jgi:hypothetical protein
VITPRVLPVAAAHIGEIAATAGGLWSADFENESEDLV